MRRYQINNDELTKTIKQYQYDYEHYTTLSALTPISINYLSTLDYVDLHNLCQTSKEFKRICDDNLLLKQILSDSISEFKTLNDFMLPPYYDVATPLKLLYQSIKNLVDKNYPEYDDEFGYEFPRWINISQFKDDMMRQIYYRMIFILWDMLYNYEQKHGQLKKGCVTQSLDELSSVNKVVLSFPFLPSNEQFSRSEINFDRLNLLDHIDNHLQLDVSVAQYIEDAVLAISNHYTSSIEHGLFDILFVRSYTRKIVYSDYYNL